MKEQCFYHYSSRVRYLNRDLPGQTRRFWFDRCMEISAGTWSNSMISLACFTAVCAVLDHTNSTRESKWGQKCHFWQVNVLTQQQPADPAVPRLPDACARPVTPSDPGNRFPCHPDELRWHCPNWPAQSPSPLRTAHSPADHRGQHHWRTNKTHQHIITACISIWINVPLLLLLMCVYSTFEIQWNGMFSQLRNVHGTLSTHKKLFISPRSCLNFTSQGFRRLVKVVAQLLTSNTSINPGEQQI